MRGKARSLAPIIRGMRKLPSTAGTAGIRKKNTRTWTCMANSLLAGSGWTRCPPGGQHHKADEQREKTSNKEEEGTRHQVEQRDALVVHRQEPRLEPVACIQVGLTFSGIRY